MGRAAYSAIGALAALAAVARPLWCQVPTFAPAIDDFADRRAVIVGVTASGDGSTPALPTAEADAQAVYDALVDPQCGRFKPEQVDLLVGQRATRPNVLAALGTATASAHGNNLLLVFWSGRAVSSPQGNFVLLADSDARKPEETAVSVRQLSAVLGQTDARAAVYLLDFHGTTPAGGAQGWLLAPFYDELFSPNDSTIMISSAGPGDTRRLEGVGGKDTFGQRVAEMLRRTGDATGDSRVTVEELYEQLYWHMHYGQGNWRGPEPRWGGAIADALRGAVLSLTSEPGLGAVLYKEPPGPAGPPGPMGARGPQGEQGPRGPLPADCWSGAEGAVAEQESKAFGERSVTGRIAALSRTVGGYEERVNRAEQAAAKLGATPKGALAGPECSGAILTAGLQGIVGEPGPPGPRGPNGPTGPPGPPGRAGTPPAPDDLAKAAGKLHDALDKSVTELEGQSGRVEHQLAALEARIRALQQQARANVFLCQATPGAAKYATPTRRPGTTGAPGPPGPPGAAGPQGPPGPPGPDCPPVTDAELTRLADKAAQSARQDVEQIARRLDAVEQSIGRIAALLDGLSRAAPGAGMLTPPPRHLARFA